MTIEKNGFGIPETWGEDDCFSPEPPAHVKFEIPSASQFGEADDYLSDDHWSLGLNLSKPIAMAPKLESGILPEAGEYAGDDNSPMAPDDSSGELECANKTEEEPDDFSEGFKLGIWGIPSVEETPEGQAREKRSGSKRAEAESALKLVKASGETSNVEELFGMLWPSVEDRLIFCEGDPYIQDERRSNVFRPVDKVGLLDWLRTLLPQRVRLKFRSSVFREVIDALRAELDVGRYEDTFNAHPDMVNAKNGVVYIGDGVPRLVDDNPEIRFNYFVEADFMPNATGTIPMVLNRFWKTSLDGEQDKLDMLLEFIGYSLSDTVAGKVIMFMLGVPNSGKSLMCNFVQRLLPPEVVTNFSLDEIGNVYNGQQLCRAKLNVTPEVEAAPLKVGAALKSSSGGGDRIAAGRKFRDSRSMMVRTKLLCAGNAMPELRTGDPSDAIFERLVILPFSSTISVRDPDLLKKLLAERNEIFSLSMYALARLVQDNFRFTWSEESKNVLDNYRHNANSMLAFMNDELAFGTDFYIGCRELYEAYKSFCCGVFQAMKLGEFKKFVLSRPGVTERTVYVSPNHQVRCYIGIGLKNN